MRHPAATDPDRYEVIFENQRVRMLEYRDKPDAANPEVRLEPDEVRWLDAQSHVRENIGATPTHVVFVELKD